MRKTFLLLILFAIPLRAGLSRPVTVIRDKWGVSHIYAQNQHDLFYAQGFVQAQDRMYQMEIWKRAGQGRLAEIFGPSFVGRDVVARKLRYRGPMTEEYRSYSPDTFEILEAFTDGINASIDAHRHALPAEFALAGFAPEHWKPEDCIQRMAAYGLMSNATSELRVAAITARLGATKTTSLVAPKPPSRLDPASSIDYASLDPEMLRDFIGSDLRIEVPAPGSNNWVVSGARTASGMPLLANDPHRTLSIPSLRYLVHLVAPGWNVIGAVEPALPGVAIGHNEQIAWGLTVFAADQEDLYVERLRGSRYRTESGWRPLRIEHETIAVKNSKPVEVDLEFTRHGPVIWRSGEQGVALRWAGTEPGTAGYLGSLAVDRAVDWPTFRRALRRWKVPGENMVYADRRGHIGEQSAALVPRRSWTGMLPVEGSDGRREWAGFIPLEELPHAFDPRTGFLATANNLTLPKNDPRHIGHAWGSEFRIHRIDEVLRGSAHLQTSNMKALQNDVTSLAARAWLELLRLSGIESRAAEMLRKWDGRVTAESGAALLYEVWMHELRPAWARRAVGPELATLAAPIIGSEGTLRGVRAMPPEEQYDFLRETLSRAFDATRKLAGDDPEQWRWGAVHHARFRHNLDALAGDRSSFDPAAVERPGDGDTVDATGWIKPYDQTHGATFREVIDLSDWDRSQAINAPGQSGTPGNPHYADLLPLWEQGGYFPLLYSRAAIEANSEETVTLQPLAPEQ